MKKRHISKKKKQIPGNKSPISKKRRGLVVLVVVIAVLTIFILLINSGKQKQPTAAGPVEDITDEDVSLEEVREKASDAFLVNDENVDAADIDLGLG